MPATIEVRNGILYVNSARVTFPKDAQHQSAPVLMGIDYDSGALVPLTITSDGKLRIYVDDSPLEKTNITAIYTYVAVGFGLGKTQTIKEYETGAIAGSPARLTTYTYGANDKVSSIVVTSTTV